MEMTFTRDKKLTTAEIEAACTALQLQLTMLGSLKTLPANIHWHYKMPAQKGVLEITLLLHQNKLIFNCKKNRMAEWITGATESIKAALKLHEIKP